MTYDPNAHSNPHINAVPGAVCNRPVLALMVAGINALLQNPGKRGGWKILRGLRKQLQALYRTERSNFELWLRHHLRRNRYWRARVLKDLGGERALRRWERRRARQSDVTLRPNHANTQSRPAQPSSIARATTSTRTGVKTDNQGLFRLAIIKTRKAGSQIRSSASYSSGSRSAPLFPELRPIGLTPDDLREYSPAEGEGAENAAMDVAPYDLWSQIMATLMEVHAHLIDVAGHMIDADVVAHRDRRAAQLIQPKIPAKDAIANHSVTHPD